MKTEDKEDYKKIDSDLMLICEYEIDSLKDAMLKLEHGTVEVKALMREVLKSQFRRQLAGIERGRPE